MDFVVGGNVPLRLTNQAGQFRDGTFAFPTIAFLSDTNTGLFRPGTDQLGIAAGGATSAVFNSSGIVLPQLSNTVLAVDSVGQIIATSSSGGSGTSGTSGISGTSGTSGLAGVSGTSGSSGVSGTAGTSGTSLSGVSSFGITIDGGGSVITTGVKGYITIPYSGTINGWDILADQSGSIVIDVWKDTYASFPPSVADTIAGSEKPTLSSAQKNQDNSLSTWTTSVTADDIVAFNVDSASTVTRVTLSIKITRA
jgi:hypothetical protein